MYATGFNAMQSAREWFCQGRGYKGCAAHKLIEVLTNDALRHKQILRISPIKELKVLAKAVFSTSAVETTLAGCRIRNDNGISYVKSCHVPTDCRDNSGDLVTETGGYLAK